MYALCGGAYRNRLGPNEREAGFPDSILTLLISLVHCHLPFKMSTDSPSPVATVKDFVGKVAFITGAASGMGRATAELLASRGASIALVDIRPGPVQAAAASISKTHNVRTIAIAADCGDWAQVEYAVNETVHRLGGLHCAFNAAGLPGRIGPGHLLADYPVE